RERQAAAEVAVVDALTRRPAEFRDGRGARPGHPLDTLLRPDVFGPDVRLDADYVRHLLRREARHLSVEAIHVRQADDTAASRRLAGRSALTIVEVQQW